MEVSMMQILDARENRARIQKELITQYQKPLLCFTMNIPGPEKWNRDICAGFFAGKARLKKSLGDSIRFFREVRQDTGWEGYYIVDLPAAELKKRAVEIEENCPLGRLFDMDVLDTDGHKLSRSELGTTTRKCLLCEKEAVLCARSRTHTVSQLREKTDALLLLAWDSLEASIADTAHAALLQEVFTTPKPGLVDKNNSGAHRDMDISHFLSSADALQPYFARFFREGCATREFLPQQTFARIRPIGMEAEQAMLAATGGVNTHKGAIFSLGLLCAAAGRLSPHVWSDSLLSECARMTEGLTQKDFAGITEETNLTAGQKLYLRYGITGVRGQAETGFPAVKEVGLPVLRKALADGKDLNDAACFALLHLICAAEDTNLMKRGGMQTYQDVKEQISSLLEKNPYPDAQAIRVLDEQFIRENLSPGGSADLLALTLFLHILENNM